MAESVRLKGSYSWPKKLPDLTAEQLAIRDDFMRVWHEKLGSNAAFGPIEQFNHGYSVKHSPSDFTSTLEIGAGLGEHLNYEKLTQEQRRSYVSLELRANMIEQLRQRFPDINVQKGDCQRTLNFQDGVFDRILAIHVLEHLPDLPAAVKEMYRLCNKEKGVFSVVIPCEGGLVYGLARLVSSQRLFESLYKQPYKWFIEQEHLSIPDEITSVLFQYFDLVHIEYFPFRVPVVSLNLCIGLTLRPKNPDQIDSSVLERTAEACSV